MADFHKYKPIVFNRPINNLLICKSYIKFVIHRNKNN
jgi:hypothetical protein